MYGYGVSSTSTVMLILGLILAVAATVLAFIFIIPSKKREKLGGFFRFLHDVFNFKFLIIEKIAGKPLDDKVIEKISSIFFSLLIILMLFIIFNDITLLVKG